MTNCSVQTAYAAIRQMEVVGKGKVKVTGKQMKGLQGKWRPLWNLPLLRRQSIAQLDRTLSS